MNRLLTLTIILILFGTHFVFAQPDNRWIRYYDGHNDRDVLYDVYSMADSSLAMCGQTATNQRVLCYWLVVTDVDGGLLWQRTYQRGEDEFALWGLAYSVIGTEDNGFLMGGRVGLPGHSGIFNVLKVDRDGDQVWWRSYGNDNPGECRTVIETKGGNYLAAGQSSQRDTLKGYAVFMNEDGDVIWENHYGGGFQFNTIREVDNGFLFAGNILGDSENSWLLKIDDEGDIIWSRSFDDSALEELISCNDGGFAACGGAFRLLRFSENGELLWSVGYEFDNADYAWSHSLTQVSDNGFVLVGEGRLGNDYPALIVRTDNAGNLVWQIIDDNGSSSRYYSVVTDHDDAILSVGKGYLDRGRHIDGVLVNIVPERQNPEIVSYFPEQLELGTLIGDTITFSVTAEDAQDDSIRYRWMLNGDAVSVDTSAVIIFDELGSDTIQCVVSDGELSDSVRWIVHVEELFIDSYSPQTITLSTRRNNTTDFNITTRSVADDPVVYAWLLNDEQIADDDSVSIRFERGREHSVTAVASQGELSDSVTWQVVVNDLIVDYMPAQFDLSVPVDTTFEFEVFRLMRMMTRCDSHGQSTATLYRTDRGC